MTFAHRIRMLALKIGVELNRYNPVQSQRARLVRMITHHNIDTVIDVGANNGGYGRFLRESGYTGDIVSFEPLAEAHRTLLDTVAKDPRWHVAKRMALGAENIKVAINVSSNSTSSSILLMKEQHMKAAPESCYVGVEHIDLRRLDSLKDPIVEAGKRLFLKIDTQGYEMQVLQGVEALMPRIHGIQLELSLTPLYENQPLYREVIEWLYAQGFELWNVIPGFTDGATGRMLQMDGVFFHCKLPSDR